MMEVEVEKTLNQYAEEVIRLSRKNRTRAKIQEELTKALNNFKDDVLDYKVRVQEDLVRICLYLRLDSPNLDLIDSVMCELEVITAMGEVIIDIRTKWKHSDKDLTGIDDVIFKIIGE